MKFNLKALTLKNAGSSGKTFLFVFLAAIIANAVLNTEQGGKLGGSALTTGAGLALHMASSEGWLQTAGLGVALMGSFKLLHNVKALEGVGNLNFALPQAVKDMIEKYIPALSGGVNMSGLRGLIGNMQAPLALNEFNNSAPCNMDWQ